MRFARSKRLKLAKHLQSRRKKNITVSSIAIICFVFLGLIFIFIIRSSSLQISKVEINVADTLNTAELEEKSLKALGGYYLYLIPKSSIFFYSKKSIEQRLSNDYKKIKNIDINRSGLTKLEINITERKPEAIVCQGFREEDLDNTCFFVDEKGTVYEKASGFSDGVYSKYYINLDGDTVSLGSAFIEESRFSDLQEFVKSINNARIGTSGVLIAPNGSYELYIKNKDGSIAVIYFDDKQSFEKTSSNLIAFLLNSKIKSFDYINLRFGNNIFYTVK